MSFTDFLLEQDLLRFEHDAYDEGPSAFERMVAADEQPFDLGDESELQSPTVESLQTRLWLHDLAGHGFQQDHNGKIVLKDKERERRLIEDCDRFVAEHAEE